MKPLCTFAVLCALLLGIAAPSDVLAQSPELVPDRSATGGAQTLDDILARQRGQGVDYDFRRDQAAPDAESAAAEPQLATRGVTSDSAIWRGLRYNLADVSSTTSTPGATIVMQDGGMRWLAWRAGPLRSYGGYLLLGMLVILALFYLLRGKIRIDGQPSGKTIVRFKAIERFGHWLLAGSFILLAITGLTQLFGRVALIPLFGHAAFAPLAIGGKWVHNNVSWAFMAGLILVTVFWVAHNIPNRHDLRWLAVGGGLFSKGVHPPARKFNAGQKLIFWAVIVLGVSISVSGLSLLFPFRLPLFGPTFDILNATGLPQLFGFGTLPVELTPYQDMQLAQIWHAIIAFVFIAIILAHIYLGSVGMQGAFDAMGKGEVDTQWAKEHHGLWYAEVTGSPGPDDPSSEGEA